MDKNTFMFYPEITDNDFYQKIYEKKENVISFEIVDKTFSFAGTSAYEWRGILSPRSVVWSSLLKK